MSVLSGTVCDYLGEKLAWFFGITSPRFQYALDEIERRKLEQEEDEQQEREERDAELQYIQSLKASPPRFVIVTMPFYRVF